MAQIVTADWHIEQDNHALIDSLTTQLISGGKEREIDTLLILGDIFESRRAQPLANLSFFGSQLEKFAEHEMKVIAIPGNHDKIDQESTLSYLKEFQYHPNFIVIPDYNFLDIGKNRLHFIPYFKEETAYLSRIPQIKMDKKRENVLFTHVAVTGVKNNDNTEVANSLKLGMFVGFHSVFVGHYHNKSRVGKNIYYMGSLYPRAFGEDQDKGFLVLNDDLTFDEFYLDFPKFLKVRIDANIVSIKEIDKLIGQYKNSKDHIRFSFSGKPVKLKALDPNKFEEVGIDVEFKQEEVEKAISDVESGEIVYFDKQQIYKEFETFCDQNELGSRHIGLKYLKTILKDG